MSPLPLRRYRAERLLRREFEGLRARVLQAVAGRLRAAGIELDAGEVEAAYGLAWQGLYAAVLEGEQIENPAAWLVLVTFRRAVEEHRARRRSVPGQHDAQLDRRPGGPSGDLAEELDLRIRLEQLLEGLAMLNERERVAATLCYVHGFSRAEAASQMGLSEGRMRKLMEGRGAGDPGVSAKIGVLARTIEQGGWCESQGSLMRALAYGILDREGDRYRLALGHHGRCPSCRAYVLALRGVAAGLPPVALPWPGFALRMLTGVSPRLRAAAGHLARRGVGGRARGLPIPSALGGSSAGGGLALAGGPFGAKLALGCFVALGLGAGCIGLEATHRPVPVRGRTQIARSSSRPVPGGLARATLAGKAPSRPVPATAQQAGGARSSSAAVREFGPERLLSAAAQPGSPGRARGPVALPGSPSGARSAAGGAPIARAAAVGGSPPSRAAQREFAP